MHILEARDGDTTLPELAAGPVVVMVVAVERGHIEGDAEAGFALIHEEAETLVGFAGFAKSGEHAHGPQPGAVAGGMHPSQIGILARQPHIVTVAVIYNIRGAVDRLHRNLAQGFVGCLALGSRIGPLAPGIVCAVATCRRRWREP